MFSTERITEILIHGIILLIAFPIHECAHALVAKWLGDDTAEKQGRITLNPVKHLDLFGTILMLFAGFGWAKPVPINPNNFKKRKLGMALSSLAGPVSNLILAYISMILSKILLYTETSEELSIICINAMLINVGLAVFNLLPVPPLDGSRILLLILPEKLYFKVMKYENVIFIILFAIIWLGLLDTPLAFLQVKALETMNFLSGWIDMLFI
ncbi:MAG: site-2 protease family protein [Oscillospiraceae bacterium]|nr:site-2 protease family protein [Oscillospiraceae bacterium]